jgi:MFS transporter, YQGE family, putative transporter
MDHKHLQSKAWVALTLQGLYSGANALCGIFVAVYLWKNSHDFQLVCRHYLVLYTVTPIVFLLAGWYAQARDRLHVYRAGLVLHALYYALILMLRERSPEYAIHLGALLGLTWGLFWAGANTFNFDVSAQGKREAYSGLLQGISGTVNFIGPLVAGAIIYKSPDRLQGYHYLFAIAIVLYLAAFVFSFSMPHDRTPRPYHIRRALFPGKDQRDWRLIMSAALTLAGAYNLMTFLLGLLIFMMTDSEMSVGGLASLQAVARIIVSFALAKVVVPSNRQTYMRWGVIILAVAGAIISLKMTALTLVIFGLMRSVAMPLFGIPHFSLCLDIISDSIEDPAQRIEYIAAWEVPLALGRIAMMLTMMGLYHWLSGNELGLRISLFVVCALRIVTYLILSKTSALQNAREAIAPKPAA